MIWNNKSLNVLESGLDALNLQQKMILHNLSNVDTPGFKAKTVKFEDVLANSHRSQNGEYKLRATVYEDYNPMRPDENTVDADKESLELYQNYVQQLALMNRLSDQFTNMRYVFNQFTK